MFLPRIPTERQQAAYDKLMSESLPEAEAEALAAELMRRRGVSVSNKYRMIITLPEGETALQALERLNPGLASKLRLDAEEWLERRARDSYNIRESHLDANCHEVDLRTFKAFKRLERLR